MTAPPQPAQRRGRGRQRLLLIAGSIVAALAMAEIALRALGLPRATDSTEFINPELSIQEAFRPDPDLFWCLREDTTTFAANALGMRGWLPRGPKQPRDLRIACVGDSCTFGVGVRYEETWGMQLERRLRAAAPDRRVETILAANPGYSTHQNRISFERHVVDLAPDLTILYVGGWNDYVAAIGDSDAERTAHNASAWHSLRLARLVARWTEGGRAEEVRAAFARGEAPFGRRVPLADFRANVSALIRTARANGSAVLLVVPALTQRSLATHPIALEYRAAVNELATEFGVATFDAPRRFREMHDRGPAQWRARTDGEWPCLGDWVHPTIAGHREIAAGLFELVHRAHAEWFAADSTVAVRPVAIERAEPQAVVALNAPRVTLHGRGFAAPGAFDRVFVGGWWVRDVDIVDDATLRLTLPRTLPPGTHPIELVGAAGTQRAPVTLEIDGTELDGTIERDGDRVRVDVTVQGPPGWRAQMWFSHALREPSAATRYGPFALVADPDGRPAGFPQTPFYFENLALISKQGRFDAAGTWHVHLEHALPAGLENLCVQGWVLDPRARSGHAVVTRPLRLAVPR